VGIDGVTGGMTPCTASYVKRLSEFRGIYRDGQALQRLVADRGDVETYTVREYRAEGADIFFGTTTMQPGLVGDEYFMTRGHFHARADRGEIYYTQSGTGILLLQSRSGEVRSVPMAVGTCAFIPPDWAHRSVNTGHGPLVFVWCCNQDAGHDYAEILTGGMGQRVVARHGSAVVVRD
jgi:glucose-6-phosphate isomerase, archaeal